MSAITVQASSKGLLRKLVLDEPFFTYAGLLMLALCGPTILLLAIETRSFLGQNPWIKPLKFEVAIAVFLLSLAFYARYLPDGMTARLDYRFFVGVVIFCGSPLFQVGSLRSSFPAMR